jgi:ABC-type amino acid transport substrate-binding protein
MPADRKNRNLLNMKRVLSILAIITLVAALCCPASATRDVKVALTELKPTLYTDDQGKPAGFFVDLITDIAAQEDWNVIWVRGSLSESWNRLSTGEIDLLPGVTSTPERETLYEFSHESALSVTGVRPPGVRHQHDS